MTDQANTAAIRKLNDALREGRDPNGCIMLTEGIRAGGEAFVRDVFKAVQAFDAFDANNDPYAEHDFGALTVDDRKIFFKVDYFDRLLTAGSPDPADPCVTIRVLTIMLAEEY